MSHLKTQFEQQIKHAELSADGAAFLESMYEQYLFDRSSLSEEWQDYFASYAKDQEVDQPHSNVKEQFILLARNSTRAKPMKQSSVSTKYERRQVGVLQLIAGYRNRGHQKAKLDPLGMSPRTDVADLKLETDGLSKSDLDTVFQTGNLAIGKSEASLQEIVNALEAIYCGSIGSEYMHIVDTEQKRWIQARLEGARGDYGLSSEEKINLFTNLTKAEELENYLARKFSGAKRFGLEGGESFIPLVDELIQRSGNQGIQEVVIGMAHRGRLNTLVNILGKDPNNLFEEFKGKTFNASGSGDVKYHQGFSSNIMTPGGEIHLALAFNPSHLEIVSPVVEGSVRARQIRRNDDGKQVLPIIVHGDAAFAGQGVVMETFQMSQTRGFGTGGTVHVIINNQVGFTTSNPDDARSTEYCTDVAKMVQAPIFHVNGDDPEAVIFITRLALDFRMTFKKDVVIDMFCYRRRGHNEADEPSVTQPMMYQNIRSHASTTKLYADELVKNGVISRAKADETETKYREQLDSGVKVANALVVEPNKDLYVDWSPYLGHSIESEWETGVDKDTLKKYAQSMAKLPEGFELQRQVKRVIEERTQMQMGEMPLNWGAAEVLAYASLVDEGFLVRLTGQDSGRGTFAHRHAVLHSQADGSTYVPLEHIAEDQERFVVYDSLLSEEAVLAFEYGYATTYPTSLIIWEAQFGDFVNGAQVVIDQFISSGQTKWERLCGLTMLLPHGFEGQGPEHSSARLERFLQLCAEDNMQVINPTTPAQIFHALRRQAVRPTRVPLIVMSPKSLLRHKLATSELDELCSGSYQAVISEIDDIQADAVDRVVLCSGKVYYDLLETRREKELNNSVILRVEELYPFPSARIVEELGKYPSIKQVVWCQEEPLNQGAWTFVAPRLYPIVIKAAGSGVKFTHAARQAAAAPAYGSAKLHQSQQQELIYLALGIQDASHGEEDE